jgi:hypothetical protein
VSETGWNFNNSAKNESILKPLCQAVEQHYQLPARRLYRYFATWEDPAFINAPELGPQFRGFHIRFERQLMAKLPLYLRECFFRPEDELGRLEPDCPYENLVAFDDLIYIRHSTCLDPTGCAITYAHELRHVVQQDQFPRLMKATSSLRGRLKDFLNTATEIDIPVERDANIISKRVAEQVCGVQAVRRFAEQQVMWMRTGGGLAHKQRWEFFRDVPSPTAYDWVNETVRLVESYKGRIDTGMDVSEPQWWVGPVA